MDTFDAGTRLTGGVFAAGLSSLATSDELQSLVVGLLTLAVRELIYWWSNRNRATNLTLPPQR